MGVIKIHGWTLEMLSVLKHFINAFAQYFVFHLLVINFVLQD